MRKITKSKVIADYGQWKVTKDGVECEEPGYTIEKHRVHEVSMADPKRILEIDIAEKGWADMHSFQQAIDHARQLWPAKK